MSSTSPRLFGTSGIRGHTSRVNTDISLNLGRSLGTMLEGPGVVGVGTDARTSGPVLLNSFRAGLLSTGVDVVSLGICPMPAVAFYSTLPGVLASVIITASHNPPTDNGFKFFREGREFIRTEEAAIETAVARHEYRSQKWLSVGTVAVCDIRMTYLRNAERFLVTRGRTASGMDVLVDSANGAASDYTPHLLRNLGFRPVTINAHPDGHFPGRLPEPSPQNLQQTMTLAAETKMPLTVCHDGDGDRVAVIDEEGRFVDQNRVIALFARDEVERQNGGTVVASIDTSSVIDDVIRPLGGVVVRVPLGSLQEFLVLRNGTAVAFASEPWKPIFAAYGYWMDGVVGAARVAQMVDEDGSGSTVRLFSSIPEYPVLREQIPCPDHLKPDFMRLVRGSLISQVTLIDQINDSDGIRIDRSDGSYVLVRVSGTEPKARVYIGARTRDTLDRLAQTARSVMDKALEEAMHQHSSKPSP
ncbi:MAG: phosphoglucosamine mutase [Candidatus Thorarchaeota archaeon]|nr:phosphoglucosamine mutase [Candidatus Thorarchaeota archaeon]